ncbi:Stimulator of interferon genes protein [Stylophora pistillata]|uniref:Stimulator of interferon genes protein n=1 Tax=Stylophora pistillata TaxID=50429 RepID=A0A2B4SKY0_STYPI|nr:Stimulator of interferon genes protein [Stylophora pistillata]
MADNPLPRGNDLTQQENNGFGPLFKRRGRTTTATSAIMVLSPVEKSDLYEKENKNVADGLAKGFYFGYLRLVLPQLNEKIADSVEFRYLLNAKKVFILLPKTCFTCDSIVDADSRVKWADDLPPLEISRGGILKRIYKHAVYKVEMPCPDGTVEEYHFILEYAMPLMTLYDMSQYADPPLSHEERGSSGGVVPPKIDRNSG